MQLSELTKGLQDKFTQSRIVFWYDAEQSFTEEVAELIAQNALDVTIVEVAKASVLATKHRIEMLEPEQPFLLYFNHEEPEPMEDWLLDVRLYSEQFFADHSSMLLNELGLTRMSLRHHLKARQAFFASKQRLAGLKKWLVEHEDEASLDRKMMATVLKADSASETDVVLKLLHTFAQCHGDSEKFAQDKTIKQLHKFELLPSLWQMLQGQFSYTNDSPSIANFVLQLFCTELWAQINHANKDWLTNNVLPSPAGRATALALLSSWRDSRSYSADYTALAHAYADKLDIRTVADRYAALALIDCQTFEQLEQVVIRYLVDQLVDGDVDNRAGFDAIIASRLTSYWCDPISKNGADYRAIYLALRAGEQFLHLHKQHAGGFHYDSCQAMYKAYCDSLYKFDQTYRLFNEHAFAVQSKGADILRRLDEKIENIYCNGYLAELGLAWDKLLEQENRLANWAIAGVPNQYQFFKDQVANRLATKQMKRVFVIISDALRYEVAHELADHVNNGQRYTAALSSQLGVLPSYTQLGMASLLPHQQLAYKADAGVVLADGRSTQGFENRHNILASVNGMAVKAKDLLGWSNQEGRDKVADAQVIYIYHDTIDAIGDKAATEERTFEACRNAVNELTDLVARVVNRLNASRVIVTADHGFLFQQQALANSDKTALQAKPAKAFEAKKRYVLGHQISSAESCWKGSVQHTANGDDTEFLLPKAAQRFHFTGGARFVHGGAMLQEICVPVVQIRELQKEQVANYEKRPVGVIPESQNIKLVNNIDKVRFIQTDAVNERFTARTLDIYIADSEGNEVSGRETVQFDSASESMNDRVREVRLKLRGASFDRMAKYTMVLEDPAVHTHYATFAVTIDLAIQDDFFS